MYLIQKCSVTAFSTVMALASGAQLNPNNADSQQHIVKKNVTLMQAWHYKKNVAAWCFVYKTDPRFPMKEERQTEKAQGHIRGKELQWSPLYSFWLGSVSLIGTGPLMGQRQTHIQWISPGIFTGDMRKYHLLFLLSLSTDKMDKTDITGALKRMPHYGNHPLTLIWVSGR